MATLKLGESLNMEISIPEDSNKRDSLISDRQYQIDDRLKALLNDVAIVEEKVNDNQESILDVIGLVDGIKNQIIRPEVKSITVHKDHTKDIENLYSFVLHHKDLTIKLLEDKIVEGSKLKIKEFRKVYITFAVAMIVSNLIHLL